MDNTNSNSSGQTDPIVAELLKRLQTVEAKLYAQEGELEKLRRTDRHNVAFSASLGDCRAYGPNATDITLVYRKVFSNTGNAYNPSTGIFTAPVKGVYYFSFSGLNQQTHSVFLKLFKNGMQTVTAFTNPGDGRYHAASNSASLNLEVGEQVYVCLGANTSVFDNYNDHTTFSGHLLFPV